MKHTQICAAILILLASGGVMQACSTKTASSEIPPEPVQTAAVPVQPDAELTAEAPRFSAAGGFYDEDFMLRLFAEDGAEIHYTLDGSTPTAESPCYSEPIAIADRSAEPNTVSMHTRLAPAGAYPAYVPPKSPVDKATVVRAMAIAADGSRSPVISQTYFVGFGAKAAYYQDMKILSLAADERSLFDEETGIFVLGKTYMQWRNSDDYDASLPDYRIPANYSQSGREWERPASLEIFADGRQLAAQEIGIRVHGGATRSYAQKSLNLYARSVYGLPKLNCDLFSGAVISEAAGTPVTEFDTVMLRNGGNDAMYTRFRDRLNQRLSAGRAFLTQGMVPCILFLNGEFWGQYELTEKMDAAFIKAHCGIPKKNVCIIKKEALDAGSEETFAEWKQLRQWISETDFSDPAAYAQLCEAVDMQSFMDYISCEVYIANANWDKSNSAMWKAETPDPANPYADGRWRFLMFDTDYSTGIYGEVLSDDDSFARLLEHDCFLADLLRGALENADFREQFAAVFTEIADTNFSAACVESEIDALAAFYRDPAIDTFGRFWGSVYSGRAGERIYQESVEEVREFYSTRRDHIMEYLEQYTQNGEAPAEAHP